MRRALLSGPGVPALLILSLFCAAIASPFAQGITLVDFGASKAATTFALSGWNTLLLSPGMLYSSAGPDGVVMNASHLDEFSDYRGVRGTARSFNPGERIVVTWYNNSNQHFVFSSRISFDDPDAPSGGAVAGTWFTMRSLDDYRSTYQTIAPQATARTVFNITSAGVHKSDGFHALVNVNLHIEWFEAWPKQYILCDRIELFSDADITAPAAPGGLTAQALSDSKMHLQWQAPLDNVGVVEYLIYLNGEIEGYSREPGYTAVFLKPGTPHSFAVTALDAAGNESALSVAVTRATLPYAQAGDLVHPGGLTYRGAFRLPDAFLWGGEAMAFHPLGDGGPGGSGAADGYPGSLFVTDVNQREHGFVGEVSIPAPVLSPTRNLEDLPVAQVLRPPVDIRPANVNGWGDYVDIWRTGLVFQGDEERLYSVWSVHYTVTGEKHACLSCCNAANLAGSARFGAWHVGDPVAPPRDAMLGDYLFALPAAWASANTSGRSLVTGRCRDGGLSGLGPTLYAVAPVGTAPPAANTVQPVTTLLEYGPVSASDYYHFPDAIDGYLLSDAWRDAAWLSAGAQNSLLLMGNKARGANWYGYMGERMAHDWVIADIPYPEFYDTDPDGKGWKAHNFIPMAIFYDPEELAQVANGTLASHQPQPYAALRFDPGLFYGAAREIRTISFDAQKRLLYALEFDAVHDGALVVHVWEVEEIVTGIEVQQEHSPGALRLLPNYPNPCNAATRIRFYLPKEERVVADLCDVRGVLIKRVLAARQGAGWQEATIDLEGHASGIYLLRVAAGVHRASQKILLVR